MRGLPAATQAETRLAAKTTISKEPIDVRCGSRKTIAASPDPAPIRAPRIRSVSFSIVSAVVPSETM
jgi:hypothetical protein